MAVWTGSGLWSLYVFLVHLSEVDWLPVEMQAVPDALVCLSSQFVKNIRKVTDLCLLVTAKDRQWHGRMVRKLRSGLPLEFLEWWNLPPPVGPGMASNAARRGR